MEKQNELVLFGGEKGWNSDDWTASDDRVRGGSSQSYLETSNSLARFHGTLDTKTLGGAGFASQRTVGEDKSWDLSSYDGIYLEFGKHDSKRYTFILKDQLLPRDPDTGREQSTISYEYDFKLPASQTLFIPWKSLKATYRGREKDDAPPLKTSKVKRFSIMMRSFFDKQDGDFSLELRSVKAVCQSQDLEGGITGDKDQFNAPAARKPWSWKESNLVGLAFILSTTWAICFGYCWWNGYDTSPMTFKNWWRVVRS